MPCKAAWFFTLAFLMLQTQVEKKLAGVTQANRTDSEVPLECNTVLSF